MDLPWFLPRPLVKPMFTGKVDLDYARKRHPIWVGKLSPVSPESSIHSSAAESPEDTERPGSRETSWFEAGTEVERKEGLPKEPSKAPP